MSAQVPRRATSEELLHFLAVLAGGPRSAKGNAECNQPCDAAPVTRVCSAPPAAPGTPPRVQRLGKGKGKGAKKGKGVWPTEPKSHGSPVRCADAEEPGERGDIGPATREPELHRAEESGSGESAADSGSDVSEEGFVASRRRRDQDDDGSAFGSPVSSEGSELEEGFRQIDPGLYQPGQRYPVCVFWQVVSYPACAARPLQCH